MHFRNVRQRAAVCRTLLSLEGLAELWGDKGPRLGAQRTLLPDLPGRTRDARVLLLVAWAVWDGTAIGAVADLFRLGDRNLVAVGQLLQAMARGPDEIDGWVDGWLDAPAEAPAHGVVPSRWLFRTRRA